MKAVHVVVELDAVLTVAEEFRPQHSEMRERPVNNCLLDATALEVKDMFNKCRHVTEIPTCADAAPLT